MDYRNKESKKVTLISFVVNIILTIIKFAAGIIGNSGAMIADAVHSLSDFFTDIVVFVSIRITAKPADEEHNYGHGKIENVASVIVSVALIIAGFTILKNGIEEIIRWIRGEQLSGVGPMALAAAGISVAAKEALFRYAKHKGEKLNSQVLIANAWHNRSDALSSIGTLIGVGGAVLLGARYSFLDSAAQIIVSFFIFRVSYKIIKPNINQLMDCSLDKEEIEKIIKIIEDHEAILDYHKLKTRKSGYITDIDIHIQVNKDLTVEKAHDVSEDIEGEISELLGEDTVINIHIEPHE